MAAKKKIREMRKNLQLLFILILLAIGAGIVWSLKGGTRKKPLANFAIEDTAAVTKIVITDADLNKAVLERDPNSRYWDLNGKHKARKDAVDLLLKTALRIRVKGPVPEPALENVLRQMAGAGKKVEYYQGGDKPVKTYYIGTATQDHTGTYMLLETPEEGKSSEPFIMYMEGFVGFLNTRYFTDEEEWRYTGIFDYPNLEISQVDVIHHEAIDRSFTIYYNEGNDLKLQSKSFQMDIPVFDTLAVKDYYLLYKKVHLETYVSHLTPEAEDSLLNSQPAFTLAVTEKGGNRKKIDLYWKTGGSPLYDEFGNLSPWDGARMYGVVNGDDVVLVQRFVFDPLIQGIESFLPR
jgi:hypothetical protein